MTTALVILHYFACIFLIGVILLQAGKGADIGAAFGGASQTVFGGRGPATFLSKLTAAIAIIFLITSVWLAHISKYKSVKSVMETAPVEQAPAGQAPTAPQSSTQLPEKSEAK